MINLKLPKDHQGLRKLIPDELILKKTGKCSRIINNKNVKKEFQISLGKYELNIDDTLDVDIIYRSSLKLNLKILNSENKVLEDYSLNNQKCEIKNNYKNKIIINPIIYFDNKFQSRKFSIDLTKIQTKLTKKWKLQNKEHKGFVVTKGSGGLGDNLNVMIRAKYYAQMTGRTLIVDWRNSLFDDLKPAHFNYDQCNHQRMDDLWGMLFETPKSNIELIDQISNQSTFPKEWNSNLHLGESHLIAKWMVDHGIETRSIAVSSVEDEDKRHQLMLYRNKLNDGIYDYNDNEIVEKDEQVVIFNGPNIFNLSGDLEKKLYQEIKFSREIKKSGTDFIIKHNLHKCRTIGVHYRHGNGEQAVIKNTKADCFMKFVKEINKHYREGDKIFLSTDSKSAIKVFEEVYSEENVFTYPKWLPEENSGPLHKHRENKKRIQNLKDGLIEIYILSKTKMTVVNHSSFNWWAKYNQNPKGIWIQV